MFRILARVFVAVTLVTTAQTWAQTAKVESAFGMWRGPIQFKLAVSGQDDLSAHAIQTGQLELLPDGRVKGSIPDGGCQLSGLWRELVNPTQASLEIVAQNCKDPRFSSRYRGTLTNTSSAQVKHLSLDVANPLANPRPSLSGVMRR